MKQFLLPCALIIAPAITEAATLAPNQTYTGGGPLSLIGTSSVNFDIDPSTPLTISDISVSLYAGSIAAAAAIDVIFAGQSYSALGLVANGLGQSAITFTFADFTALDDFSLGVSGLSLLVTSYSYTFTTAAADISAVPLPAGGILLISALGATAGTVASLRRRNKVAG